MMRLLGILVVLAVLVAGIGFWRGWFSTDTQTVGDQKTISVTVDKDKVDQDKAAVKQDLKDLTHK